MLNQEAIASVRLLPNAVLDQEHRGQQLDNLCGSYWAAILLRAHGWVDLDAEPCK
jgi:hypothetical protein